MKKQSVLALLTLLTVATLSACGNSQTANSGASTNTQTESEVSKDNKDESNESNESIEQLSWIPLCQLSNHEDTLRTPFEEVFNTKLNTSTNEKEGNLYRDKDGYTVQNNTLYGVIANTTANQIFERDKAREAIIKAADNTYIDLVDADEDSKFYMAINGYFNLLPDRDETHCDFSSTLSRAEFMAMLMRAETPVDENLQLDTEFTSAVGLTEYNLYAQQVADHAYINLTDKSLNKQTYNDKITRAEALYLLMNHYYGEGLEEKLDEKIENRNELESLDLSTVTTTFTDAKDGGDIAESQGYADKDNATAYALQYAINNTTTGLPTDLYKALVFAERYGLIDADEETRWDETLTKSEAIEFIYKTFQAAVKTDRAIEVTNASLENTNNESTGTENNNESSDKTEHDQSYYYDEWGNFDRGLEEAGITKAEDNADGWIGFQCYQDPDGTPYCIHNKSGERFELGDRLPNGSTYTGSTPEEAKMWSEMQADKVYDILYGDTEE